MPFVAPGLEIRRAQQEDRFAIKDLAADVNDRASKDSTDFSNVSNVPAKADAIGALVRDLVLETIEESEEVSSQDVSSSLLTQLSPPFPNRKD